MLDREKEMTVQGKRLYVVDLARQMLGVPYKARAKLEDAPFEVNCSTLTAYIFQKVGVDLSGKAIMQARSGIIVLPYVSLLLPADLIFIKSLRGFYDEYFPYGIGHVGIYTGKETVISARKKQGMVVEENIRVYLAREEFRVIKRVILGGNDERH